MVLREQADLSGAAGIPDRVERRRFVYESLRALAERTQAPLRRALSARGISFRSHFLVNMLDVMYQIPSDDDIEECVITRDVVKHHTNPITILRKAG